eukprot:NODE_37_length_31305_cov_0.348939.p2 type:complete len:1287 gc:universal NODE_37_length_31305_cov_0.348939:13388-9528(-)
MTNQQPNLQTRINNELSLLSLFEWMDSIDCPFQSLKQAYNTDNWDDFLQSVGYDKVEFISLLQHHKSEVLARLPIHMSVNDFQPVESTDTQDKEFPFIFSSQNRKMLDAFGHKFSLPLNATVITSDEYKEIILPPPPKVNQTPTPIIQISDCDDLIQSIFTNISAFNEMQSIVFNTAYNSNENILLSAPTSAGKTNISLLTIARVIQNAPKSQLNSIKIVYIAPMKALVSEITAKFRKSLSKLGLNVKEVSGDIQLTRQELLRSNIIVTTPEKCDVLTRKMHGHHPFMSNLQLLIIDEIHLLQSERGAVLECLVARIQQFVESSQQIIRMVGLSATVPNHFDVADFIKADYRKGLLVFDNNYRPVPLTQHILSVNYKQKDFKCKMATSRAVFDKIVPFLKNEKQVMIFVHSRNDTLRVAKLMQEFDNNTSSELFDKSANHFYLKLLNKLKNKQFLQLLQCGIGVHHAGLLRHDRNMIEKFFLEGDLRLLVCTATLAWGVNLPSSMVIIHGTSVYDPSKSDFKDLDILDVAQIFGRAGRPQFENEGTGMLVTSSDKMEHYVQHLSMSMPIESQFEIHLKDYLNSEIVLGNIICMEDAIKWMGFSYLHIRSRKNPHSYGLNYADIEKDPYLVDYRTKLINNAITRLLTCELITNFKGFYMPTQIGIIASHYYISVESIQLYFQGLVSKRMDIDAVLQCICKSTEFSSIKARNEELETLDLLHHKITHKIKGTSSDPHGKSNILLASWLDKFPVNSFSLQSDQYYIVDNSKRISRALFELCIHLKYMTSIQSTLHVSWLLNPIAPSPIYNPDLNVTFKVKPVHRHKLIISAIISPEYQLKYNKFHLFIEFNHHTLYYSSFVINDYSSQVIECPCRIPDPIFRELSCIILNDQVNYTFKSTINLDNIIIPYDVVEYTDVVNLCPLNIDNKFLDPISTQLYHEIQHGTKNILVSSFISVLDCIPNDAIIISNANNTSDIVNTSKNYTPTVFINTYLNKKLNIRNVKSCVLVDVHLIADFDFICFILNSVKIRIIATSIPLKQTITSYDITHYNFRPGLFINNPKIQFKSFVEFNRLNRLAMMNKHVQLIGKCIVYCNDYNDLKNTTMAMCIKHAASGSQSAPIKCNDTLLEYGLAFNIGILHDRLSRSDADTVRNLFDSGILKCLILIATDACSSIRGTVDLAIFKEIPADIVVNKLNAREHLIMSHEDSINEISEIQDGIYLESRLDVTKDAVRLKCDYEEIYDYLKKSWWYSRVEINPNYYEVGDLKEFLKNKIDLLKDSTLVDNARAS